MNDFLHFPQASSTEEQNNTVNPKLSKRDYTIINMDPILSKIYSESNNKKQELNNNCYKPIHSSCSEEFQVPKTTKFSEDINNLIQYSTSSSETKVNGGFKFQKQKTLVLDLDETLCHSSLEIPDEFDMSKNVLKFRSL